MRLTSGTFYYVSEKKIGVSEGRFLIPEFRLSLVLPQMLSLVLPQMYDSVLSESFWFIILILACSCNKTRGLWTVRISEYQGMHSWFYNWHTQHHRFYFTVPFPFSLHLPSHSNLTFFKNIPMYGQKHSSILACYWDVKPCVFYFSY